MRVDDFLLLFKENGTFEELKSYLHSTFKMKDIGPIESCLGMIKQFDFRIQLDQDQYINEIQKWVETDE